MFCLTYVSCTHASSEIPARKVVPRCATFRVVWIFLLLPILSENGFGLLEINFVCFTSDSLTTDQYLVETFTCSLFTISDISWVSIHLFIYPEPLMAT